MGGIKDYKAFKSGSWKNHRDYREKVGDGSWLKAVVNRVSLNILIF